MEVPPKQLFSHHMKAKFWGPIREQINASSILDGLGVKETT